MASCGSCASPRCPSPKTLAKYIDDACACAPGNRFAFAVVDDTTGTVLGTTSYHDILPAVKRVEIGYTWYAKACSAPM